MIFIVSIIERLLGDQVKFDGVLPSSGPRWCGGVLPRLRGCEYVAFDNGGLRCYVLSSVP